LQLPPASISLEHEPIYLDHNATTRVDARVREVMLPYLSQIFGNPASQTHVFGRMADYAVEVARHHVAGLIGAGEPDEVVFTPGATHSIWLALRGAAAHAGDRDHIITSVIEHQAVLDACRELEERGFEITYLPVTPDGFVSPGAVADAITERTLLVSVMLVQNVIGTVQPITEISRITRSRRVMLHVDAAQGVGLVPFHVAAMGVDLASLSAHKLYGPKGIGALYVRRGLIEELGVRGRRSPWRAGGTLNVPGIVGFGKAAEIMIHEGAAEAERLRALRQRLHDRLRHAVGPLHVHGAWEPRHPGNLTLSIPAIDDHALSRVRAHIAISHGSACASGSGQASHVLLALGVPEEHARAAIRIGIGRSNTAADIDVAADMLIQAAAAHPGAGSVRTRGAARTVVNCEGRPVTVSESGYTSFCAVTNAGNFLGDLGDRSMDALCAPGRPPRLNLVIPSYCSGPALGATLVSLLTQRHVFSAEITVLVNEPPGADAAVRAANDLTEEWLVSLTSRTQSRGPHPFLEHDARIRGLLDRLRPRVELRAARVVIAGGMPAVYQAICSSLVRRISAYCDGLGGERSARSRMLDELGRRTLVLICDDDIELEHLDALDRAYYHATVHDAVVLGRLAVKKPPGLSAMDDCLHDLMQLFLDVKDDLGVTALSPRGMLVRHALEAGSVALHDPFGYQLYFAQLAARNARYIVTGTTTIRAADYPSNGRFMRDLGLYLGGADNDAVAIFRNLLALPRTHAQRAACSRDDLNRLVSALERRDLAEIAALARELLGRFDRAAFVPALVPPPASSAAQAS
jgi:cysteine desulfurase